jgi:hypothetical protein
VWLALSAFTLLSWWLGARHDHASGPNALVTCGVIAVAALKVRIIVTEFMEARRAPPLLRRIADAWLALLTLSLLAIYLVECSRAGGA